MPSNVGQRRLYHQRITHPAFKHAGEVVAWLGAMQGQDYAGTKWAFGLRLPGSTDADIERAIADKQVLRTWALRGTLHYVAPADIHWLIDLLAERQIAGNARRYKELELDEPTLTRSTDLIAKVVQVGQRSREEIFAHLNDNGISTAGQRGFYMLQRAGLERLIVQGAMVRNVTTFLTLDSDLGKTLPKEEALAELARRYFTSHAPATLADFATWSGLPMGEARAGLADVKADLVEDTIDGRSYWLPTEATEPPQAPLYLLPGFDEYVLGYKERSAVLDPAYNNNICPGGNGMFSPTIVVDGRIIGTWKRTIKKKSVDITPDLFPPYAADFDPDLFAQGTDNYGEFLGLSAVVKSAD